MVGHGRSSASSYLADPTSPIPSHCASIVATSTLRVNGLRQIHQEGNVSWKMTYSFDVYVVSKETSVWCLIIFQMRNILLILCVLAHLKSVLRCLRCGKSAQMTSDVMNLNVQMCRLMLRDESL